MATWLITGCSTGLGRALAQAVLAHGHNAVVTARNATTVQDIAAAFPDTALALPLDVTDLAQISSAVRQAHTRFGGIDVLVNNAGYGYRAAVEEADDADIRRLFDTNVFGAVDMIKAVLPEMRAKRAGSILNISSIGARISPAGSRVLLGNKGGPGGPVRIPPQGTAAARHQRHRRRAGRVPHGLRRPLTHPVSDGARGLCGDGRKTAQGERHDPRQPARRPGKGRRSHPGDRRKCEPAVADGARQRRVRRICRSRPGRAHGTGAMAGPQPQHGHRGLSYGRPHLRADASSPAP